MDLSTNSNMKLGNVSELTEYALDLSHSTTNSAASVEHRAIVNLREIRNRQQQANERSSAADLQLKRRQEFDIKFNDKLKKRKLDENIMPVREETPRPMVEISRAQTPPNIGILHRLVQLLQPKKTARVSTNRRSTIPYTRRTNRCPAIKQEPASNENLIASNTLTAGNSLIQIPSPSSAQSVAATAHISSVSEGVNIKQEPNGEESTSSIVSNIDHDDARPALEELSGVQIGPHGTRVSEEDLANINETEASIATRQLMSMIFDRATLATHTLSGKPSPAFLDRARPLKAQLDPLKVADIIYFLKNEKGFREHEIRKAITMKCADTAKAIRRSLAKANLSKLL
uniref:BEN domain-containing protein n=1 Tax=Bactrocera latifrons TaxID=174628 RepID=A0A0K8W2H8_BACLA